MSIKESLLKMAEGFLNKKQPENKVEPTPDFKPADAEIIARNKKKAAEKLLEEKFKEVDETIKDFDPDADELTQIKKSVKMKVEKRVAKTKTLGQSLKLLIVELKKKVKDHGYKFVAHKMGGLSLLIMTAISLRGALLVVFPENTIIFTIISFMMATLFTLVADSLYNDYHDIESYIIYAIDAIINIGFGIYEFSNDIPVSEVATKVLFAIASLGSIVITQKSIRTENYPKKFHRYENLIEEAKQALDRIIVKAREQLLEIEEYQINNPPVLVKGKLKNVPLPPSLRNKQKFHAVRRSVKIKSSSLAQVLFNAGVLDDRLFSGLPKERGIKK